MAQAGVTHDVTIGGMGFMLAQVKGNYTREVLSGYDAPAPAIETDTETLESPDGFGFGGAKVHRVYFDKFRGSGLLYGGLEAKGEEAGLVLYMCGFRPLLDGQGIGPVPGEQGLTAGNVAGNVAAIFWNDELYVAMDDQAYVMARDGEDNFVGLTLVGVLTANVISAGYDAGGRAWYCCADGTIRRVDNPATTYGSTVAADFITVYSGVTFRAWQYLGNNSLFMQLPGGAYERFFPTAIRALCVHEGALFIGCDDGLYRLTGHLEPSNPSTSPGYYDLFRYNLEKVIDHSPGVRPAGGFNFKNWQHLTSFAGHLWCGLDGRLVAIKLTSSGSHYDIKWQRCGPGWVKSIAVAANMLFVLVQSPNDSSFNTSLWGYDPGVDGWFQFDTSNQAFLISGGGAVRNAQLISVQHNSTNFSYWSFDPTNPSGLHKYNFRSPGLENWFGPYCGLRLPVITPDELARAAGLGQGKQGLVKLQRFGVEWDTPYNLAPLEGWPDLNFTVGQAFFVVSVSMDDGRSQYYLSNATGSNQYYPTAFNLNAGRTTWNFTVDQQLIKPVGDVGQPQDPITGIFPGQDHNGNGWMLELGYFSAGPGPLVRRMFLDYQVQEFNPQIGCRWKLVLALDYSPEAVRLDGQAVDQPADVTFFGHIFREADAAAFNLWSRWSTGATVEFVDVNGGPAHTCKIVSLKQERAATGVKPALASTGGVLQSNYLMTVELVEVID